MVRYFQWVATKLDARPADLVHLFKTTADVIKGSGGVVRTLRPLPGRSELAYPFKDRRGGVGKLEKHWEARKIALEFDVSPQVLMKVEKHVRDHPVALRVMSFKNTMDDAVMSEKKGKSTSLHIASRFGLADRARNLYARGYDENARDRDGKTPIDIARENGHELIVKILTGQDALTQHEAYTTLYQTHRSSNDEEQNEEGDLDDYNDDSDEE